MITAAGEAYYQDTWLKLRHLLRVLYYDLALHAWIAWPLVVKDQESDWEALRQLQRRGECGAGRWLMVAGVARSDGDGVMVYFCIRDHRSLGGGTGKHERRRDKRLHPLNPPSAQLERRNPRLWMCWGVQEPVLLQAGPLLSTVWAMPGPGPSPEEWPSPATRQLQTGTSF